MKIANMTSIASPKSGRTHSIRLNQLKKTVRRKLVTRFGETLPVALVRRTVDEAEQLAHATGFPQLVFPLLAEEMVHRVAAFLTADEAHGELASAA
jgi:hypothetical protein